MTPAEATERVIYWIHSQGYSQRHWATVATECLAQEHNDYEAAVRVLAEGLKSFHRQYRDAVVKPNNLLNELLSMALSEVDWTLVARSCLDLINTDEA